MNFFARVTKLYFEVSSSQTKAGLKKKSKIVSVPVLDMITPAATFDSLGKINLALPNIRLRPHKYRPVTLSAMVVGEIDVVKGACRVQGDVVCHGQKDPLVSVELIGYDLEVNRPITTADDLWV